MTHPQMARARALQADGDLTAAEKLYLEILADTPDDFRVLNNLGTVYEAQGNLNDALATYQKARNLAPDTPLLAYNLAHLLYRQERYESAIGLWGEYVGMAPDDPDGHFNLGVTLVDSGSPQPARDAYRKALDCDPTFHRALTNLGNLHYAAGEFESAESIYGAALEHHPSGRTHFDVAKTLESTGEFLQAIDHYVTSVQLEPDSGIAHQRLIQLLMRLGDKSAAVKVADDWLSADPDNPVATHTHAVVTGAVLERASDDYVRKLFDEFATDFDDVLGSVNYAGPEIVATLLQDHFGAGSGTLEVLDAGCGTGLCGAVLRNYAGTLIGVDLSSGMLDKARQRGIYDRLDEAELGRYLHEHQGLFDLICAADTLNYFGKLEEISSHTFNALRPGGHLIFTSEQASAEITEYQLETHGRFSHNNAYVLRALEQADFTVVTTLDQTLRNEGGVPVSAGVFLARKDR